MWYFAYGSDLSQDSILDWSKSFGQFVPPRGAPQPAVLVNHRLCFPAFEEFWKGGVADAVPEAGRFCPVTIGLFARANETRCKRIWFLDLAR